MHELCSYHVQAAVKTTKAARPEMSSSATSLSHTVTYDPSKFKRQLKGGAGRSTAPNYDTKTGLLPDSRKPIMHEGSTTYVVRGSGKLVPSGRLTAVPAGRLGAAALASGNGSGGYIPGLREGPTVRMAKEQIEREKRERAERRQWEQDVVDRDEGKTVGGEYVAAARKARMEQEERKKNGGRKVDRELVVAAAGTKGKGKRREESEEEDDGVRRRRPFSSAAVRLIGYDPTGMREEDKETKRRRVSPALYSCQGSRVEC